MIFGSLALGAFPRGLRPDLQSTSCASAGCRGPLAEEFVSGGDGSSSDCSSDIVGRGLSSVEPLHVTAVAEQVPVQRETAAAFFIT